MGRLQKGVNDLETWCLNNGSWEKQLMNEWTGECDDGTHYKIDEISFGSQKKFRWRCSKGHEWFAVVFGRTSHKTGYPHCLRARPQKGVNDLESWCLSNGSFGKQLISEWTGACEDGTQYNIDEITKGSQKKFKWKCSEGHEWFAGVHNRTTHKQGCPYCYEENRGAIVAKAKLSEKSSLKTLCFSNGLWGKQLMDEWTGECEDGKHYKIDEISFGSQKKFRWRCSKGHEWFAKVVNRTKHKQGCPYCYNANRSEIISKANLSEENSLKTWCLTNGSFGERLKSEWTGECDDGKHYEIDEVSYGSSKKKFKWKCSKGHEWSVNVKGRTSRKTGCPYCNTYGTSYPEQFFYHSLKQIYPSAENRCKVLKSLQNPHGVEFDIGIPEIPLCIEYSPTRWHEGKEERDQYKKDLCKQCGIRLIQIIEDSYNELPLKVESDYICFKMNYHHQDEILEIIVAHILKSLGHSISEIDIERVKQEAYESSKGIEKEIQDTD